MQEEWRPVRDGGGCSVSVVVCSGDCDVSW